MKINISSICEKPGTVSLELLKLWTKLNEVGLSRRVPVRDLRVPFWEETGSLCSSNKPGVHCWNYNMKLNLLARNTIQNRENTIRIHGMLTNGVS